jgi:Ca2+-binding RTX toxin-like protein
MMIASWRFPSGARRACSTALVVVVAAFGVSAWGSPAVWALSGGDGLIAVRTSAGIEVAAPDGSDAHLIVSNGANASDGNEMSWSPTGTQIAYVGQDNQVWVARADGSDAHVVSLPTEPGTARWPQWSPDGRVTYNMSLHAYLVDADGTHRQALPSSYWTAWTPDGRLVLLRVNPSRLIIGRADATAFRRIAPDPRGELAPGDPWQFGSGGLVAYHVYDGPTGEQWVNYYHLAGRTLTAPTDSRLDGRDSVTLSPSGARSAVVRGGQLDIWDVDPQTLGLTYEGSGLVFSPSPWGSVTAWQPTCTITSSASNTTVSGTAGSDLICVSGSGDIVRGRGGNDVVYVTGRDDVVRGGTGRDVLVVHGGRNTARGGHGRDLINIRDGARSSVVNGGRGTDVCIADSRDRLVSCS